MHVGQSEGGSYIVQQVEQLADAHRAYAQLFEVCQMEQDEAKLQSYMMRHRVLLPGNQLDMDNSAATYVFGR